MKTLDFVPVFDTIAAAQLREHCLGKDAYELLAEMFQWYSPFESFCEGIKSTDDSLIVATNPNEEAIPHLVGVSLMSFGNRHAEETLTTKPQAVIEKLVVDSYLRSRGIGEQLLERSAQLATVRGFSSVWIQPRTPRNRRYYQRNGYNNKLPFSSMMQKSLHADTQD
ncbi:MAG: GNAT family N-acetyltransferase [Candidatus Saccharimonadales bacterium]